MSIQDLKQPPQHTSDFYLEKIFNRLGTTDPSNGLLVDIAAKPPTFSPPRYAIWVNTLWFLSFAISLTYATLAMMLQQWGRRYIRVTQPLRSSPHKRARVRAFFSGAVDGLHVLWVIEGVRAMTHLSMFLFFAGLLIYLFNICHGAFVAVASWVALAIVVYVSFTLLPIFRPNSPYYAPLSPTLRFLCACTSFAVFNVLSSRVFSFLWPNVVDRFRVLRDYYRQRLSEDIGKNAEECAEQLAPEIDAHVLETTFHDLHDLSEDASWEKFFEAVPSFLTSKLVNGVKDHLPEEFWEKFGQALGGFLDRTFSFNSVTESVRSRRLVICLNAAHTALGVNGVSHIFRDVFNGRWPELLQSAEIGHSLRHWSNSTDKRFTWDVRRAVTQIVVGVRERDNRWISLVQAEYGIPFHVLRDYIGQGDSVLLSILIHMTRQAFQTRSCIPWILSSLSKFSIRDTFPELQHAFCALWNDIVLEALDDIVLESWNKSGPKNIYLRILRETRHAYMALHQGTGIDLTGFFPSTHYFDPVLRKPRSYRPFKTAGHRQSSAMHKVEEANVIVDSASSTDSTSNGDGRTYNESDEVHKRDLKTRRYKGKRHHAKGGRASTRGQGMKKADIIAESPPTSDQATASELGEGFQTSRATSPAIPVHTSPRPTDASSIGAGAATLQETTPIARLSCPEIFSAIPTLAPTSTQVPVRGSTPPIWNKSLSSCDADPVSGEFLPRGGSCTRAPDTSLPPEAPSGNGP